MKILIEASEAYRNSTGVGRFSRALIAHLPGTHEFTFSPTNYASRTHSNGQRTFLQRITHASAHFWLTQVTCPLIACQSRPELVHSLSFFAPLGVRNLPSVITIFDLAYFELPEDTDRFWGSYARAAMPLFARRARAIVTTSEVMRGRIVEQFGIRPEHVHVVYGGVDPRFRVLHDAPILAEIREKYQLRDPFILYVGAWHKNKNLEVLLRANVVLSGIELVLTGTPHTRDEAKLIVLAASLKARARFIGFVPDADLPALYNLARVVVQPSLYEGFGLPVIEAMACGTPVIVSDIPVLREVAGNAAQVFPPDDPAALAALLAALLESTSEHATWSDKAAQHAQQFDWTRTARQICAVWEQSV